MKTLQKFLLLSVSLFAVAAVAQQNPPHQGKGDEQGPRRMPSVEDQTKNLTEKLGLTDDQQPKVKAIVEDTHSQMMKIMQDENMAREDTMAKMRTLHEAASAKVNALLTDDQKKKFEDMQKEMREHMRQRQQEGGDNHPK